MLSPCLRIIYFTVPIVKNNKHWVEIQQESLDLLLRVERIVIGFVCIFWKNMWN